jgi:hypothetical protein
VSLPIIDSIIDNLAANVIGISGTQSIAVLGVLLIIVLGVLALTARVPFELVVVLLSPILLVLALNGIIPGVGLGIGILLLASVWTVIIIGVASGR